MVIKHYTIYVFGENLKISQLRRGVLDTTLCDKVCQCFATGR